MTWSVTAPSNIALIKYMGKKEPLRNEPINPSLSYTLPHLHTTVTLTCIQGPHDTCDLQTSTTPLSSKAKTRFLDHLAWLKTHFQSTQSFHVYSHNNFPHGAGLASSASSFAALTQCATRALSDITGHALPSVETQATWSRQGSGSSCRSFFEPWARWDEHGVEKLALPYPSLHHQTLLLQPEEKKISSSMAHHYVQTSPHYQGRSERAKARCHALIQALSSTSWRTAYEICWEEFQDMHTLFHTSCPSFTYFTQDTLQTLEQLKTIWHVHGDGPIITMDAGPNIHLLYRPDQHAFMKDIQSLLGHHHVL